MLFALFPLFASTIDFDPFGLFLDETLDPIDGDVLLVLMSMIMIIIIVIVIIVIAIIVIAIMALSWLLSSSSSFGDDVGLQ
jgi:hypothetical protein